MSTNTPPEHLAILVRFLLAWEDLTREELASRSGLNPNTISSYCAGKTTPSRAILERLAAAANVPLSAVDSFFLPGIAAGKERAGAQEDRLVVLANRFARSTQGLGNRLAESPLGRAKTRKASQQGWPPAEVLREEARTIWKLLADCEDEDRWFLVEGWKEFQHPGLVELLCHESAEAASDRSDRALMLAKLAHRVAQLVPGDSARKKRLQGYALLYLANAVRVSGELPSAREMFNEALAQWTSAEKAPTFLEQWRVLDLEASLLRDEREFAQALARLDEAIKTAPRDWYGRLLLSKSAVLEQMGLGDQAIEVLREAASLIDARQQPRLYFGVRFNLAANLCLLDQFEEPEAMLPEIQALAKALQLELHIVRVKWLTGRVAAGKGRLDEAVAALEEARQEFTRRRSAWDCSLVTLELATVHLRQGRTADVSFLAGELIWIFEAQGIHLEAMAALALFREAAERNAATLDFTERLVRYLRKAQGDPELRFGPGPAGVK